MKAARRTARSTAHCPQTLVPARTTSLRQISPPASEASPWQMTATPPCSLCLMRSLLSIRMTASCCGHLLLALLLHPQICQKTRLAVTLILPRTEVAMPDRPSEQHIRHKHAGSVEPVLCCVARSANVAQTRCACLYELAFLRRFLLSRRLRRSQAHTVPSFFIKL